MNTIRVVPFRGNVMFRRAGDCGRCMLQVMRKSLSPIESEFGTVQEAEAYDRWFRAKVEASLSDTRPGIAHDQVMAEMEAIIQAAEYRLAAKRS